MRHTHTIPHNTPIRCDTPTLHKCVIHILIGIGVKVLYLICNNTKTYSSQLNMSNEMYLHWRSINKKKEKHVTHTKTTLNTGETTQIAARAPQRDENTSTWTNNAAKSLMGTTIGTTKNTNRRILIPKWTRHAAKTPSFWSQETPCFSRVVKERILSILQTIFGSLILAKT